MPRPALRPEPAGQDLLGLPEMPVWDQVFGFSGPLELEIGAGAGGFALEYVRRNPHVRYVAFEWRKKYAREVQHRGTTRGHQNLRVLEADARFQIPRLFADGSLDVIHLQFPDPWWKRQHLKRAILKPDFTKVLLAKLRPGGLFDFRTDVQERALQAIAVLEEAGFHNPLGKGVFHPYDPEEVPSTRERRYLMSGEPVYRARLRKL